MLSRCAWYRRLRGGQWAQVPALLWGKRWLRLPDSTPVAERATDAQIYYIHGLAAELGMSKPVARSCVSELVQRPIHYMAELTLGEASHVIRQLAKLRQSQARP